MKPAPPLKVVVIGASLGGLEAVPAVIAPLPCDLRAAVLVVQHRAPDSGMVLAELLTKGCNRPIVEPSHGTRLEAAVYLAPAGYHLLVDDDQLALSTEATVRHARPSIDVAMESAAFCHGARTIAVVLTGASDDGARGARAVANAGGVVLIQLPSESMSPIAPTAAAALVPESRQLPLDQIGPALVALCGEN